MKQKKKLEETGGNDFLRTPSISIVVLAAAFFGASLFFWLFPPPFKGAAGAPDPCACECACECRAESPDAINWHIEQQEATNYLVPPATEPDELARCRKKAK